MQGSYVVLTRLKPATREVQDRESSQCTNQTLNFESEIPSRQKSELT